MALVMVLAFFMGSFSALKSPNITASAASQTRLQTVIGTTEDTLTPSLKLVSKVGESPFDEETKSMMAGYSVTPNYNPNYEVISESYGVNNFTLNEQTSIYMWIYFPDSPDTNYFDFELEFSNSTGDKIVWKYTYDEISEIMHSYSAYEFSYIGWKKIEFAFEDAFSRNFGYNEVELDTMKISYRKNTEYANYNASDSLSIYDAYTATKTGDKTKIVSVCNYSFYAFSSSFLSMIKSLHLGSSFHISSISDVFSYVYVGKSNLLKNISSNNKFDWTITVGYGSVQPFEVALLEEIYFDEPADYIISFKLGEYRTSSGNAGNKTLREVFTAKYGISIREYTFGSFGKLAYKIEKGNSLIFEFSLSNTFIQSTGLVFSIEDEDIAKIEKVTYDSENDLYYIQVKALKKGQTNIIASANGQKSDDEIVSTYSKTSQISVEYSGVSEWMKIVIFIFLGVYGLAFIIFVIISFVNARRNIVK